MSYIKWLVESQDISLTGWKCDSLLSMSNLTKLDVKIPEGFIVTTQGYDYFMNYNKLNGTINEILQATNLDNMVDLQRSSLRIRHMIIDGKFPKDLKEEILLNYQQLSNKYVDSTNKQEFTDVTVRASAICEKENDIANTFGELDSYLNVRGMTMVLKKIKCCIASLFNDRAICYRKSINYDHNNIKLVACIQKMVQSDECR